MTYRDLGSDAATLWVWRIDAERDALGAVAMDPARLWPTLVRCGCKLRHFTDPLHRVVFTTLAERHAVGWLACATLAARHARECGLDRDAALDVFELWPPSQGHVQYRARRLLTLAQTLADAQHHLDQARRLIARGVASAWAAA